MEPLGAFNSVPEANSKHLAALPEEINTAIAGYLVKSPVLPLWRIASKALLDIFRTRSAKIFSDFVNAGGKLKYVSSSPERALTIALTHRVGHINLKDCGPISASLLKSFFEGDAVSGIATLSLDLHDGGGGIDDLEFVSRLHNLNGLRLSNAGDFRLSPLFTSLHNLAHFTSLRIERATISQYKDLSGIEKLTHLKALCICSDAYRLPISEQLGNLTNLAHLELAVEQGMPLEDLSESEQNRIADGLKRLSKLKRLNLQDNIHAQDVFTKILHLFTDLEYLNFSQIRREDALVVERIAYPISQLTNLVELNLQNNSSAIEAFLRNAHHLRLVKHLNISKAAVALSHVLKQQGVSHTVLEHMTTLETLKISVRGDRAICEAQTSAIGRLINLKFLDIQVPSSMASDNLDALSLLTNLNAMAVSYKGGLRLERPIFPWLHYLKSFQGLQYELGDISVDSLLGLSNLRHLTLLCPRGQGHTSALDGLPFLASLHQLHRLDIYRICPMIEDNTLNMIVRALSATLQELVLLKQFCEKAENQQLISCIKSSKIRLITK